LKDKLQAPGSRLQVDCDLDATDVKKATKDQLPINQLPITNNLFKCGVGLSQAAITPLGELKMCLMIDYSKYKIIHASRSTSHATGYTLKEAWDKLKELVKNIMPDENYKCDRCELETYCKWCPARSWLEYRNFTSCVSESRAKAEAIRNSVHSQQTMLYSK
jgi:radical SAM protein with 4Fe4S-binding SPASM domain